MKATYGYSSGLWIDIPTEGHAPLLFLEWIQQQRREIKVRVMQQTKTGIMRIRFAGMRNDFINLCDFINANLPAAGPTAEPAPAEEGISTEDILFFWKDKTGRGISDTISLQAILDGDEEFNYDGDPLHEWATNAEKGDTWESACSSYTCTQDHVPGQEVNR